MVGEESSKNQSRPQSIILQSLWSVLHSREAPVLHHFVAPEQSVSFPNPRTDNPISGGMVMGENVGENFGERRKMTAQSSFLAARGSTLCPDHNTPTTPTPSHGNFEAREGSRLLFENSRSSLQIIQTSQNSKVSFSKVSLPNQIIGNQILPTLLIAAAAALRASSCCSINSIVTLIKNSSCSSTESMLLNCCCC